MTFFSKVCILAIVAYVHASPQLRRAEGEAGNAWSKFLGKVPEYFKGPEAGELENSNAHADAQNDEVAKEGGPSYPNPGQISESQWQEKFKNCMYTSNGQSSSSSSSSSSQSSNQYGVDQISGYTGSSSDFQKQMEKCRTDVSNSVGSYPGAGGGQDYFNQFKPQMPSNFGSYTSALSGSSPSGSSA